MKLLSRLWWTFSPFVLSLAMQPTSGNTMDPL